MYPLQMHPPSVSCASLDNRGPQRRVGARRTHQHPPPPPAAAAETQLQWPRGGPQAVADALVRALRKRGGRLLLRAPVAAISPASVRSGGAARVRLASGGELRARRAVVSNASLWDTAALVAPEAQLPAFRQEVRIRGRRRAHARQSQGPSRTKQRARVSRDALAGTELAPPLLAGAFCWVDSPKPLLAPRAQVAALQPSSSLVHLHGVVAPPPGALDSPPPMHTYFLSPDLLADTGWPTMTIATAVDRSLAPPGRHVLHVSAAEPFGPWAALERGGEEYRRRKREKGEMLWGLVEQVGWKGAGQ